MVSVFRLWTLDLGLWTFNFALSDWRAARLFMQAILHGEGEVEGHAPVRHRTILNGGADVLDARATDALDRHRRSRHGDVDGIFDAVRRRSGQLDCLLDHGSPPSCRHRKGGSAASQHTPQNGNCEW